jgi:ubiquinone/menaquinone biosynthesis C-methylase UbiE
VVSDPRPDLQAHYGRQGLLEEIEALLATCGPVADGEAVLARADEFHPGGSAATGQLARLAAPAPGERVLDLGCGIGGPARRLRRLVGPAGSVTGVDVVAEYCRVARALNSRAPSAREEAAADIVILQADVLALDLPGPRFDLAWSQQAQMNVADKAGWLACVHRHLAPRGRYAFHEVFAGAGSGAGAGHEPLYPVPWAATVADSHLVTAPQWCVALAAGGFVLRHWEDVTELTVRWLDEALATQKALAAAGDPAAALSVRLLLGPEAGRMSRNLRANLADGRLQAFMGVGERAG